MTDHVKLGWQDVKEEVSIFRRLDESGKLVFWPRYQDLVCASCGKLDEREALERGIENRVLFKVKRDIFGSFEDLCILSDRVKESLESFAGANVDYYTVPSMPGYYVAMPRTVWLPSAADPVFQIVPATRVSLPSEDNPLVRIDTGGVCPLCHRYRDVLWGSHAPLIKEDVDIGAFHLESRLGIMPVFVVSQQVANALKEIRPKLSGLFLAPLQ